jgi:hypothetical protein
MKEKMDKSAYLKKDNREKSSPVKGDSNSFHSKLLNSRKAKGGKSKERDRKMVD